MVIVQASYLAAVLYMDRRRLEQLDAVSLPIIVCGVLSRALPLQLELRPLRAALAQRLRQTATTAWLQSAELAEVCAALDGMQAYDPQMVSGDDVALLVQRLLAAELAVGGPYATPGQAADQFTNAYVAQCVGWLAGPLPKVVQYVLAQVPGLAEAELADWPLLAAIDMLLTDKRSQPVHELLGSYDDLVASLAQSITYSLDMHLDAESTDPRLPATIMYDRCRQDLVPLQQPLQAKTRQMIDQVIHNDADHEISKLAWYYGSGLVQPPRPIDEALCLQLGMANLYAWAAYSIYDDFLDAEGKPDMLGTANYSFRAMLELYRQVLPDVAGFQMFVGQSLTAVDQANALETTEFRFSSNGRVLHVNELPDFGGRDLLADRALFHILGPMAVLAGLGVPVGSLQWNSTLEGFRHYLIARQLNDDIHDWQKDLETGQATYVVVALLRYMDIRPGVYVLAQLMPYARQQFWQYVLPGICDVALDHLAAARHGLQQGLALAPDSYIPQLLTSIQLSMQAAKTQRADAQVLLRTFAPR